MSAARISSLLVEIGTEELPAADQEPLARALANELARCLRERGLTGGPESANPGSVYWTPRRLAVIAPDVADREPDREIERKGPPLQSAFDAHGRPTAAAQGFARSAGVPVEALERDMSGRLVHRHVEPGRPIADVLRTMLPEILAALPLPRRMRWSGGDDAFLRPVRWLVVRYGKRTVPVEAFGIVAGNASRGHRVHHPGTVPLDTPGDYVEALRSAHILADPVERLAKIEHGIAAAAQTTGAMPSGTEALYREIAGMTEWPVVLAARFDARFLDLPDPVIVTTLVHHQRFVPLRDAGGNLTNHFVAVVNLESRDPGAVRHGLERVVRPRLEDAAFYYRRDRKRPLADYGKDLAGLAFAPKLGSMAEKAARLSRLTVETAPATGADAGFAERAARLAKCDLVTGMIFEFPELQGVIGGHYAAEDGEAPEVARAIAEQYLPAGAEDALPATPTGVALALADRLDTLVGGFAAGMAPSGTRDPFGLRRAAFGALRLAAEKAPRLDLGPLLEKAAEFFPESLKADSSLPALREFLRERLRFLILERGNDPGVAQAVLSVAPLIPGEVLSRADALGRFRHHGEIAALAAANKRIANILRQADARGELLRESDAPVAAQGAEFALDEALEGIRPELDSALARYDFQAALTELATLREPIDRFFDDVLVMDPDPEIRSRRLALLVRLRKAFLEVADLGELQITAEA